DGGASLQIMTWTFNEGWLLPPGHTYVFEIRYKDGENVGFSEDRLELRLENGQMSLKDLPGGDRTGEGQGEQEPASVSLTAGTSGSSNRAARTSAQSEQRVTISGGELDALIKANPEQVTIIQDDLRVSLPPDALESLALDEGDALTIIFKETDDGGVDTSFAINDEPWAWPFGEPYAVERLRVGSAAAEEIQSILGTATADPAPGGAPFLPILSIVGLSGAGFVAYKLKGPVKRS
ncbi:MAG: hypothetical protein FWG93_08620, partial [Oscillospiraceae bacterium]|nr:hypothetical protein [Oscillospiraceae bacterium]